MYVYIAHMSCFRSLLRSLYYLRLNTNFSRCCYLFVLLHCIIIAAVLFLSATFHTAISPFFGHLVPYLQFSCCCYWFVCYILLLCFFPLLLLLPVCCSCSSILFTLATCKCTHQVVTVIGTTSMRSRLGPLIYALGAKSSKPCF